MQSIVFTNKSDKALVIRTIGDARVSDTKSDGVAVKAGESAVLFTEYLKALSVE